MSNTPKWRRYRCQGNAVLGSDLVSGKETLATLRRSAERAGWLQNASIQHFTARIFTFNTEVRVEISARGWASAERMTDSAIARGVGGDL